MIDHFNWNKLVYESEISFEPVIGEIYHLSEMRGLRLLSMISPGEWPHKHLATLKLNVDLWKVLENGNGCDPRRLFDSGTSPANPC